MSIAGLNILEFFRRLKEEPELLDALREEDDAMSEDDSEEFPADAPDYVGEFDAEYEAEMSKDDEDEDEAVETDKDKDKDKEP